MTSGGAAPCWQFGLTPGSAAVVSSATIMSTNSTRGKAPLPLLRYRRTKIVATLGPASKEPRVIEELIAAGANVFRLNMSHGTHESHQATYEALRAAAKRANAEVAVLADLSGPKIRVGSFPEGSIVLVPGKQVTVTTRDVMGAAGLIPSQYERLASDVVSGDRILLDDGNLELRVDGVEGSDIRCTVVTGGLLKDHKGMNLPGVRVSVSALTEKDKADAKFAIALGVDMVALSFVRSKSDIEELHALLATMGRQVPIIAKIEKPEAVENIDEIVDGCDALMVARGDLGVELPAEQVPGIQEQLVDIGRIRHRPVIVATQMLESMITSPRPTRAEATDVANAVRSGADAVMLSAESASGAHPVEAVRTMDRIIRQTESLMFSAGGFSSIGLYTPTQEKTTSPMTIDDAVAEAAALLSRELRVRGLVVMSRSGRSIKVMSAARPAAPLVGVTHELEVSRFGCLMWGVVPVTIPERDQTDPLRLASQLARDLSLLAEGAGTILVVRGLHADPKHNAPTLTVVPLSNVGGP